MAAIMENECRQFPVNKSFLAKGIIAIHDLYETDQLQDAKDLLFDLRSLALRVHGPDHRYTMYIENMIKLVYSSADNEGLKMELGRVEAAHERNELGRKRNYTRIQLSKLLIVLCKLYMAYVTIIWIILLLTQSVPLSLEFNAIIITSLLSGMISLVWMTWTDSERGTRILDFLSMYV
jgi:hypothetical protein